MIEKEVMKTAFRNNEVIENVEQEIVKEYTEEIDAYQNSLPLKKTFKLDKSSVLSGIVFNEIIGKPKGW